LIQNLLQLAIFSDLGPNVYIHTLLFVTWIRICAVLLLLTTLFLDAFWIFYIHFFYSILPFQEPLNPQTIITEYFIKPDIPTDQTCPICLDLQDSSTLKSKSCGHEFHQSCLINLFHNRNYNCPLCMGQFRDEKYEYYCIVVEDCIDLVGLDDDTLSGSRGCE
jgi:Ring finger domain